MKKISHKYKENFSQNIRMIKLSLNELKLVAQERNKSDYENISKKDLVKTLSEPKPKIGINKRERES